MKIFRSSSILALCASGFSIVLSTLALLVVTLSSNQLPKYAIPISRTSGGGVSLRDFTGTDDTATANNDAAIVRWLSACSRDGQVPCYAPAGTYRTINSIQSLTSNLAGNPSTLRIKGDGPGQTVFFNDNTAAVPIFDIGSDIYQSSNVILEDFSVRAPRTANVGNVGIKIRNRGGSILRNIQIDGTYVGLDFEKADYAPVLDNMTVSNTKCTGVRFSDDNSANAGDIRSLYIFSAGNVARCFALEIGRGGGMRAHVDIEGSWGGISLTNGNSIILSGDVEGSGPAGNLMFFGSNSGITLSALTLSNSSSTTWSNVSGLNILGVQFYNYSVVLDSSSTAWLGHYSLEGTSTLSCKGLCR